MPTPIYLDHAATTPLDPRVLEAMMPYLKNEFGNASSVHKLGRRTRFVVEECREKIAAMIGAEPSEVVFTSGGTEANNLAIRGASGKGTIVTSGAEHEAVLRTVESLAKVGRDVVVLRPDSHGAVSEEQLAEALSADASLVSLMHANNELGTLSDIRALAFVSHEQGAVFHTDAVQTMGVLPIDVEETGVDLLSASAHKFYGPKGIGFLFVRGGIDLDPQVTGGSQERRRRGGTENVAAIVGMAEALSIARVEGEARRVHLQRLRDAFIEQLEDALGYAVQLNSPREVDRAIPGIINISFPPTENGSIDGEMLLLNLDMEGVMASAGSACTSGAIEPSHVLQSIGVPDETAQASVRFSFGKENTLEDVQRVIAALERTISRMRGRVTEAR